MAGLLSPFMMGPAQQLMQPQMAQAPGMAMPQASPLAWLRDPSVALPVAAALIGGQGNRQSFANAAATLGPAMAQTREKNATMNFFRQKAPEYAAAVEAGVPVGEAWKMYNEQRMAQIDDSRPASIREFEYGQKNPDYAEWMKTKGRDAPLTATDKRAILEADELVLANQTTVDMLQSVIAEPSGPGSSLNDRAGHGATAGTQAWLARNDPTGFFDDAKGQATTELENVVLNQALSNLKAIFGAAPTEGERKILVELQASIDKTPAERKVIIERAIQLANKRLEFNRERADGLRGGEYYRAPQTPALGGPPASAPAAPGQRLRFNPATGELE